MLASASRSSGSGPALHGSLRSPLKGRLIGEAHADPTRGTVRRRGCAGRSAGRQGDAEANPATSPREFACPLPPGARKRLPDGRRRRSKATAAKKSGARGRPAAAPALRLRGAVAPGRGPDFVRGGVRRDASTTCGLRPGRAPPWERSKRHRAGRGPERRASSTSKASQQRLSATNEALPRTPAGARVQVLGLQRRPQRGHLLPPHDPRRALVLGLLVVLPLQQLHRQGDACGSSTAATTRATGRGSP